MTDHGMASPLHWPIGQQRTPSYRRKRNPLWKSATVSTACVQIEREVERIEGRDLVVSTNLALRIDGFPRSGQPEPTDPGAAVFFVRKGKRIALACDRYQTVRENLRAIGMHLEALRSAPAVRVTMLADGTEFVVVGWPGDTGHAVILTRSSGETAWRQLSALPRQAQDGGK